MFYFYLSLLSSVPYLERALSIFLIICALSRARFYLSSFHVLCPERALFIFHHHLCLVQSTLYLSFIIICALSRARFIYLSSSSAPCPGRALFIIMRSLSIERFVYHHLYFVQSALYLSLSSSVLYLERALSIFHHHLCLVQSTL